MHTGTDFVLLVPLDQREVSYHMYRELKITWASLRDNLNAEYSVPALIVRPYHDFATFRPSLSSLAGMHR